MNYEGIAELVNSLFRDSQSLSSLEQKAVNVETSELETIQNVFSKYSVSGDALTIEALPLVKWG